MGEAFSTRSDVIVIGAGLTGLAAAHRAVSKGLRVAVLEASDRAGGPLRSVRQDGYLLELGPNTVLPSPELDQLIDELSITPLFADRRSPRFVWRGGDLRRVPTGPGEFVTSELLSWRGKLRLLAEPFVPRRAGEGDETLAAFARRRFGHETLDYLVAPFVSGVWAGDAEALSVEAMGRLADWERRHGSVLRGAIMNRPKRRRPGGLVSFENGLETIPKTLAARLGDAVHLNRPARALTRTTDGWRVDTPAGPLESQVVFVTAPAHAAARLVEPLDAALSTELSAIRYAGVAVLHLSCADAALPERPRGFGFLSQRRDPLPILGCLFSSDLYPGRAPAGRTLLTVFMGGDRSPDLLERDDASLAGMAAEGLRTVLGASAAPELLRVTRYRQAIPQYITGHAARLRRLGALEARHGGLTFFGNYRDGISVGDVVKGAFQRAEGALAAVRKPG